MTRLTLLPFTCLLALGCVARAADPAIGFEWSRDTLVARFELLHELGTEASTLTAFAHPFHVRAAAGELYIADRGNDRVAVVDSLARIVRWIGSPGRGPGELYGVSHIAVAESRLLVAEALNGRVSEFTLDGRFVRAYHSPFAAGAIATTSTRAVTAATSSTHYAMLLVRDSAPISSLPRMRRADRRPRTRWAVLPGHDLVAGDSTRFWVFDQGSGSVCRFDHVGRKGRCATLPGQLIQRLRRYRDERVQTLERSTSLRVAVAPLAKDMVRVGSHLAILLPLPELPIVLIDVDDGALTPVVLGSDSLPMWARRTTSFAWAGQAFVLASDYGIGRLFLSARPTVFR